jgi:hypothetical protein
MGTLKERATLIAQAQGWDDHTLVDLLLSFIAEKGMQDDAIAALYEVASDENGE